MPLCKGVSYEKRKNPHSCISRSDMLRWSDYGSNDRLQKTVREALLLSKRLIHILIKEG